jgi:tripartite-type tricarboxylate transporter receptor subunit TctC
VLALLAGQVQAFFGTVSVSIDHIRGGRLRPLGVTSSTRLDVLPDVAPIGDFVPGYEASGWEVVGAPKDTPAEIVRRLNQEINSALADPTFRSRLADLGVEGFATTPGELAAFIGDYTHRWAKLIQAAGIKAE